MRATLSDVAIGGEVTIKGRVLYLTSDGELLQRQLSGENLIFRPRTFAHRQHLDRRAHARLGLLLLRRDARSVLPGRPARRHRAARTRSRTAASESS